MSIVLSIIRGIIFLSFVGSSVLFGFFTFITAYARNFRLFAYSLIYLIPSLLGAYFSIKWMVKPLICIALFLFIALVFAFLKITEPDLSLIERFMSPERLEKRGKLYHAARKYEERGDFIKAAETYIKANSPECAAWAYEKAKLFDKAAECYEMIEEYKDASEAWEKAGNLKKAAEVLEKLAEREEWYLEDAAKLWEKVDKKKAKEIWRKVAEYYEKEAKEEGAFYEDAAETYKKIGDKEKAKDCYRKFIEYCKEQAKEDKTWYKYIDEAKQKIEEL